MLHIRLVSLPPFFVDLNSQSYVGTSSPTAQRFVFQLLYAHFLSLTVPSFSIEAIEVFILDEFRINILKKWSLT
jgi:hypothetical protein